MSLRLALKRSLDPSSLFEPSSEANRPTTQPSSSTTITMAEKKKERGRIVIKRKRAVTHRMPEIHNCISNEDPSQIDKYGFVEMANALPRRLIELIYKEAREKVARYDAKTAAGAGGGGGGGITTTASNDEFSSSNANKSSTHKNSKGSSVIRKRQSETSEDSAAPEVEEISNALQVDVSERLTQKVQMAITMEGVCNNGAYSKSMRAVFGSKSNKSGNGSANNSNNFKSNYNGYVLETPKVLITPPGSAPQLPHADDHCTSCMFCLIHLKANQEPTRIAKYNGLKKDYPTGITVECDECNREEQLPDGDYRRGVHLTDDPWICTSCGPGEGKHRPYDFEGKLTEAFGELLEPDAPNLCDSYAGKKTGETTKAGDGLLGLPTLIHRGPGNPSSSKEPRYILFFTLRPLFANAVTDNIYHRYNPNLQIHASCILYNQFKKVKTIYERGGCGLEGYFGAIVNSDTAALMRENGELKEENEQLRNKLDRVT